VKSRAAPVASAIASNATAMIKRMRASRESSWRT
jgi:hypothetical protein